MTVLEFISKKINMENLNTGADLYNYITKNKKAFIKDFGSDEEIEDIIGLYGSVVSITGLDFKVFRESPEIFELLDIEDDYYSYNETDLSNGEVLLFSDGYDEINYKYLQIIGYAGFNEGYSMKRLYDFLKEKSKINSSEIILKISNQSVLPMFFKYGNVKYGGVIDIYDDNSDGVYGYLMAFATYLYDLPLEILANYKVNYIKYEIYLEEDIKDRIEFINTKNNIADDLYNTPYKFSLYGDEAYNIKHFELFCKGISDQYRLFLENSNNKYQGRSSYKVLWPEGNFSFDSKKLTIEHLKILLKYKIAAYINFDESVYNLLIKNIKNNIDLLYYLYNYYWEYLCDNDLSNKELQKQYSVSDTYTLAELLTIKELERLEIPTKEILNKCLEYFLNFEDSYACEYLVAKISKNEIKELAKSKYFFNKYIKNDDLLDEKTVFKIIEDCPNAYAFLSNTQIEKYNLQKNENYALAYEKNICKGCKKCKKINRFITI